MLSLQERKQNPEILLDNKKEPIFKLNFQKWTKKKKRKTQKFLLVYKNDVLMTTVKTGQLKLPE